jgi:hypothetical protein
MSDAPELKVVDLEPLRDITPNEQAVKILEHMLELAKKGEVRAVAVAAVDHENAITTIFPEEMHYNPHLHLLGGAIARLQHRFQTEAYEAAQSIRTSI